MLVCICLCKSSCGECLPIRPIHQCKKCAPLASIQSYDEEGNKGPGVACGAAQSFQLCVLLMCVEAGCRGFVASVAIAQEIADRVLMRVWNGP